MTDSIYGICLDCGRSHHRENRRRLIRLMLECEVSAIRAAWPCFYPPNDAGDRMLFRDKAALKDRSA